MPIRLINTLPKLRNTALTVVFALLSGCAAQMKYMDGWYHLDSGEYAEGLKDLEEAAKADPENTRFRSDWLNKRDEVTAKLLARADGALLAQNLDGAREIYQTILAYQPSNERAMAGLDRLARRASVAEQLQQAQALLKAGDRQQAQALVNRILEIVPDFAEAKALQRDLAALDARDLVSSPSLSNLYKKPITLEFRDASLKMVFEVLSKSTGINFILDKEIRSDQRTTIFLKQSSLDDAVDMLAATNQLDKKVLNSSSVLIYPNTPAKAKEYQDLVVRAFYLKGSSAKDTANLIKTILKLKDVFVDEKLNMLVVRDTPEAIGLTEKLVNLYDLPEPEVVLDVAVLEIDRTRAMDLGLSITDSFKFSPLSNTTDGNGNSQSVTLNDLLHLNRGNIWVNAPTATFKAHQDNGDAELLANPRIRVRNHEKAKIHIGDKIPVISTTTSTTTNYLSENIQYLDVGIKLDVEPTIYTQDDVGIKVGLEVSSLGTPLTTKSGSVAYQIGNRSAETTLRLHDGETQVLAGLLRKEERNSASGLPGITSLPLLGRLFAANTDKSDKTEIVLSITPHLVRGIDRKDAGAEMFWSGTEAVLRAKPLQLRVQGDQPGKPVVLPQAGGEKTTPSAAPTAPATSNATPAANAGGVSANAANNVFKLGWSGPAKLKAGQEGRFELTLSCAAALRGLPMQLAYDPKVLEVIAVEDGGYFNRDGQKGSFSNTIDKASGRVAVALGGTAEATTMAAKLLIVRVRALGAGATSLDLAGAIPVGGGQAVGRPTLPIRQEIVVE